MVLICLSYFLSYHSHFNTNFVFFICMYEEKGFKALRLNEFAQFESLKIKISSQFFLFFL